ncbi:MAG: hypothetical protein RMJ44_03085 [Cytophagales bacterium]|nr:hypothetical protein [Bernardetiaceae bacterium]MDW8210047.1 hypothetical protein [Cytophagales bacterium]
MRYSKQLLALLEEVITEQGYALRYEKGNFKPGYCIVKNNRIVLVNQFFTLEGKINCLIEIIRQLGIESEKLSRIRK